jgi:prepilin-type N-terminal cleavage/methylation domain-containing protein
MSLSYINSPVAGFTPRERKNNNMKIKTNGTSGFTLVEIMIVVAIIGLLATVAVPNFVRARGTAQKNACISNLRQIDGAKQQWAFENRKSDEAVPGEDDIKVYLSKNLMPSCPGGGTYTIGAVNADPTCSKEGHELTLP